MWRCRRRVRGEDVYGEGAQRTGEGRTVEKDGHSG